MINEKLALYFIMGSTNTGKAHPLEVLESALRGGITCFQLREKGTHSLSGKQLHEFAQQCQKLCREYGVPFIVNDDVELAIHLDADGVHVGQDDDNAALVRGRLGSNKILGVSAHTEDEVLAAILAGADYIGMGPVYATSTKLDAKPVGGTGFIQSSRSAYPELPIIGIGGITPANFKPVIQAGADGVSVISSIAGASDVYNTTKNFAAAIAQSLQKEGTLS